MSEWLLSLDAPAGFTVDRECELKAADESKAVVRYARHRLDTEEVQQHIREGKMPTRLAMTWNERVSFMLTEGMQLKKIAFLDGVFESTSANHKKDDDFDGDVAISTGELQKLLPDVLEALGGEMPVA
jgi:recombination associated protein RdgC